MDTNEERFKTIEDQLESLGKMVTAMVDAVPQRTKDGIDAHIRAEALLTLVLELAEKLGVEQTDVLNSLVERERILRDRYFRQLEDAAPDSAARLDDRPDFDEGIAGGDEWPRLFY